jgi:hypothetical protein
MGAFGKTTKPLQRTATGKYILSLKCSASQEKLDGSEVWSCEYESAHIDGNVIFVTSEADEEQPL